MAAEDIVISGVAGVFPGSDNVDELMDHLYNNDDLVSDKDCRWSLNNKFGVPNATGKLNHPSKFDAAHFGIYRKQVESLDPMTCLMLERSFEAIYDAGINPTTLKGRKVGVYMGSTFSEADNVFDYNAAGTGFGILGHNRSMLASRVSYYLDINGPSIVHLSSWVCGITALTLALRDIQSGRVCAAIVGTPNITLFPVMSWHLSELGLLSRDGKCKSFDSAADGSGRSDAVVVLFMQRVSDAKRAYATVVDSDFRFFSGQYGYVQPDSACYVRHLTEFYQNCGVDPAALDFFEADGSGVKFADREELIGVEEIFLKHRKSPLMIGSVKSNLGHTESSSALVAIVKMLIAMQQGCLPANLHYHQPPPDIPALQDGRLKVVTENTPWSGGYVGINSFGIDSNYGHCLLKSYDKPKVHLYDGLPRLVVASSRTEEGMQRLLNQVVSTPFDAEYIRLLQDIHASNIVGHIYRGFAILEPDKKREVKVEHFPGEKRPLWFVYSGMGSQWPGMGIQLMRLPVFKAAIDKCHAILETRGLDLKHIITTKDTSIFDNILHCFVGIAAVQIGLTDVLTQLGIEPDGIIGHSVGELGCSYSDGCLTAEEMILAAYARGRASNEATLIKGMMAAVGLGYNQVKDMVPPGIEVVCHNGPGSSTLSGPAEQVNEFVGELRAKGIFARSVNVANIAYHSQYIKPAAPGLLNYLKEIIPNPKPRSSRWISTSVPEQSWDSPLAQTCSAEYHTNNLLSSVLFEEGSRHIPPNAITVEVAPHGLLQAILKRSLPEGCSHTALTKRGHEDAVEVLLTAIGKLYMMGLHPQVANIYPPVEFPVSCGTPFISPLVSWEHTDDWPISHVLEKDLISGEMNVELSLSQEEVRSYAGHVVNSRILYPSAAYLKLAWEVLSILMKEKFGVVPVVFEDITFHDDAHIPEKGSLKLYVMVQRGSGKFEITEGTRVLTSGRVKVPESLEKEFVPMQPMATSGTLLTSEDVYREMNHRGHHFKGEISGIIDAKVNSDGSVCHIKWNNNWVTFIESMIQQRLYQTGEETQAVLIPKHINKLVIDPSKHKEQQTVFEVTSHLTSSLIQGGGVQIQGLKTRQMEINNSQSPMLIDTVAFVAYGNPRLQSLKDFLNVAVQIAVESSHVHRRHNNCRVTVIEKEDTHSLVHHIEKTLQNYPNIELEVKNTCSNCTTTEKRSPSFLVVGSPSLLNHGSLFLGKSGGFLLTRVGSEESWNFSPDLLLVAEQLFGDGKILLLRKVPASEATPVVVKLDDAGAWQSQLRHNLDAKRRVLLVAEGDPPAGVVSVVSQVSKDPAADLVRFVFVLDNSAPPFSLSDKWYDQQLRLGLTVNVYLDQRWGSYRLLSVSEDPMADHQPMALQIPNIEGVELNYLGLTTMACGSGKCGLGHVDFSGRSGPHRWVMGIARCVDSKPDPFLTWPVPDSWSLEDAATVPQAYATAYFAVVILGYVRHGEKILIHGGTSSVGQAAIAVATATGFDVFTTVATQEQRDYLLKKFPQLQQESIFSSEDTRFEVDIKLATKGRGVDVLLNCLPGERFSASLKCVGMFGRFIQLEKSEMDKNTMFGMDVFLRGIIFYGAAGDNLFNASDEAKTRLHHLLTAGIEAGVVQPLDRSVFLYQQYDRALGMLADEGRVSKVILNVRDAKKAYNLQVGPTPRVRFDPKSSCLITGGSPEAWLDLSEWLLARGARNLIISQATQPVSSYIGRRVDLLRTYHKATVVLTGHMPKSLPEAEDLVREVNMHGPLASIFALPLPETYGDEKACRELLRHLDRASSHGSVQHFVCLMCTGGEGVCQARCRAGLHGLAVRWSGENAHLKPVLTGMDRLLGSNIEHTVVLRPAHRHTDTDHSDQGMSDDLERLELFLPSSVDDLLLLGADQPSSQELLSLSPGVAHVTEVPPVFLVPGLQGPAYLEPFAAWLMYPAIALRLPDSGSLQDMAVSLAKEVRRLRARGPYNIVGETWGGALALEVAKCLESEGEKTQVFLLEGAPDTAQSVISQLGDGDSMETNLICRLLNIHTNEVKEAMLAAPNWEARLELAMAHAPASTNKSTETLRAAITAMRSRITALLHYKPEGLQLTGLVSLLRSNKEEDDTCGLIKYCKNTVNLHRVGSSHEEMLSSLEAANVISEHLII